MNLVRLLVCSVAILWLSASPSFACNGNSDVYSVLSGSVAETNATPALKEILRVISGNYDVSEGRERNIWLAWPLQQPLTDRLVSQIASLSPQERNLAHLAYLQNPPKDHRLKTILSLALYDFKAWDQFLDSAFKGPLLNDSLVNSLIPVIRNLPDTLKEHVQRRVREAYPKLNKINFTLFPRFRSNLRLAPRRSADALITHTLKIDELIANAVASGKTPKEAYSLYLKTIKETFIPESDRGNYQMEDVLDVGRAIQKFLRTNPTASKIPGASIRITGSIPNGRGRLGEADLDSFFSHRELRQFFNGFERAIEHGAKGAFANSRFSMENHRRNTNPHFIAQINPVFLLVEAHKISIEVYPPARPLNRDQEMKPYNYAKPTRYVLESSDGMFFLPTIAKQKGAPLDFAKETIRNNYRGFGISNSWMSAPMESPLVENLVSQFIRLDPKERTQILQLIKESPPAKRGNLQEIMELALYDNEAWHRYFDSILTKPQPNEAILDGLVPVITHMPEALKTELLGRINDVYANIPRIKYVEKFTWIPPFRRKHFLSIAPKRAADIFIRHALNGPELIERTIASGHSPTKALDAYLSMTNERVFKGLELGKYDADTILRASRGIQAELAKARKMGIENPTATIAGSFGNGRADLRTSDIDLMLSDPRMTALLGGMQKAVRAQLISKHPEAALEVHTMLHTTTRVDAAIVSPVFIEITETEIRMLVYPAFRPLAGDKFFLDHNYAKPTVYVLESKPIKQSLKAGNS